jgi:hypothetical protein
MLEEMVHMLALKRDERLCTLFPFSTISLYTSAANCTISPHTRPDYETLSHKQLVVDRPLLMKSFITFFAGFTNRLRKFDLPTVILNL